MVTTKENLGCFWNDSNLFGRVSVLEDNAIGAFAILLVADLSLKFTGCIRNLYDNREDAAIVSIAWSSVVNFLNGEFISTNFI